MRGSFIHNRLKLLYEMHKLLWLGINEKACHHPLFSHRLCLPDVREDLQEDRERKLIPRGSKQETNSRAKKQALSPSRKLFVRSEPRAKHGHMSRRLDLHFVPDEIFTIEFD